MKFKKSVCIDALYQELPFFDRFMAAKSDGFDYVEFWNRDDKDASKVFEASKKAGIAISGINGDGPFSLIDPTQKKPYIEYLKGSVEYAKKIGACAVVIHSNALGDEGVVINSYTELSDTVKICAMYETLIECAKIAEDSAIKMYLEPLNITTDHVGNYLKNTQMACEMTKLIGSPMLKVLYDVYHMQLNEGSLCDNIKKYVSEFGHIHVADAPGRHEPGTGEINYSKVFECLEENGYDGFIGYELFPNNSTKEAVEAIMKY